MKRASFATGFLALGCSTIAEPPLQSECAPDKPCPDGFVCAEDQGVCRPTEQTPPYAHLGFDIQILEVGGTQLQSRVEVSGCDCAVRKDSANNELEVIRSHVMQSFELIAFDTTEIADPEAPLLDELVNPGQLELRQSGRFAVRPATSSRRVDYPTLTPEMALQDTVFSWQRHDERDHWSLPERVRNGGFLLWGTFPQNAAPKLAMIVPEARPTTSTECMVDADCCPAQGACDLGPNFCELTEDGKGYCTALKNPQFRYSTVHNPDCNGVMRGQVVLVNEDDPSATTPQPLPDTVVSLRHADIDGDAPLQLFSLDYQIAEAQMETPPTQCVVDPPEDEDDGCVDGEQVCDAATGQCKLVLAGRSANVDATSSNDELVGIGEFSTAVYTYCEDNVPIERAFTGTLLPTGALPDVDFEIQGQFEPSLVTGSELDLGKRLCVPDWGPPQSLDILVDEPAVALAGDAWTCCDVGCLPESAEDTTLPPVAPDSCNGGTAGEPPSITLSTRLVLDAAAHEFWLDSECATPLAKADVEDGFDIGGLRQTADCSTTPCTATDLAIDVEPRTYRVRVETPVGSVFRSQIIDVPLQLPVSELKVELEERVLVRGTVKLPPSLCPDAEEDCGSEGAVVVAERLRMPIPDTATFESTDTVPGPYFHQVSTHVDPVLGRKGAYVLPLDPGVYVMTALSNTGVEGGPAAFTIVDLSGTPPETLDFDLSEGIIVTLSLPPTGASDWGRNLQVIPLDLGSWTDQELQNPGRLEESNPALDLNAITECLSTPTPEGPTGCRIRRLVPGDGALIPSQIGQVRFTARRSPQGASCPVSCQG